ncbi:alpha-amylase family protein [Paenibacillus sp. 1P07SE]|uniref:alpha-amylase family protein n=1 Tax=Paenibacillus sp. 1P07SE TaxID=3132209 RepID=UPI0039A5A41B
MKELQTQANGYAVAPVRVEWRPFNTLHSKAELCEAMDTLEACGVTAWWYSAAAKGSYPMFQSNHLPYHAEADKELFLWLTDEAHRRGFSIFSWEYLNTAPLLTEKHPEWRYQYFDQHLKENTIRDNHYVCHNSPYGDLLKKYCVEVVQELGFDGIWFDGCYMHSAPGERMACRCTFCQAKYELDTGQPIPDTIQFNDVSFRRFMEWRYEDFTAYWRSLSQYVKDHKADALIVFNYFNRLGHEYLSGSPLRAMPMEGMIASESCSKPYQLVLQHKLLQSLNPKYPSEVWDYMRDASGQHGIATPNAEPEAAIFHSLASASAGGYASLGAEGRTLGENKALMKAVSRAMAPVADFIGGKQVNSIGLVVSGATKDYGHPTADGLQADAMPAWRAAHGLHNLFNGLHWPTEAVLDNQLTLSSLKRWPMIVLPDVQCLSDESVAALMDYTEEGGNLVITGQCGIKNALGEMRTRGALDEWAGIVWKDEHAAKPIVKPVAERWANSMSESFLLAGAAHAVRTTGTEVWATATYRTGDTSKKWTKEGPVRNQNPLIQGESIFKKKMGQGMLIYVAHNIGAGYADYPSKRARQVLRGLLEPHYQPPFTADASSTVLTMLWQQEGRQALHLLQLPDSIVHFGIHGKAPIYPEEWPVLAPITIRIQDAGQQVYSPTLHPLIVSRQDEILTIRVSNLCRHALIVLEAGQ